MNAELKIKNLNLVRLIIHNSAFLIHNLLKAK